MPILWVKDANICKKIFLAPNLPWPKCAYMRVQKCPFWGSNMSKFQKRVSLQMPPKSHVAILEAPNAKMWRKKSQMSCGDIQWTKFAKLQKTEKKTSKTFLVSNAPNRHFEVLNSTNLHFFVGKMAKSWGEKKLS